MATKFYNLDTDVNLGGDNSSDNIVASQKAIKSYIDNNFVEDDSDFPLFYTMAIDHKLLGTDALGWALQGSFVSNDTYPLAVAKIKLLYNSAHATNTTYRGIDCKLTEDGRYIADISKKNDIETLFNNTGIADFYILDSENNGFYLPKTKWYRQYTTNISELNKIGEEVPVSPYASNDMLKPISSNHLLYYRVGKKKTVIGLIQINLETRIEALEQQMAKAYLGAD